MEICFLIHAKTPLAETDNAAQFVEAARGKGYRISFGLIDRLRWQQDKLITDVAALGSQAYLSFADFTFAPQPLEKFAIVWILSLGNRATFLDKMQLLQLLPEPVRVINAPSALTYFHSKSSLLGLGKLMPHPETHISNDAETLWQAFKESYVSWVVKPLGESFGRQVTLLAPGDLEARGSLEQATHYGARYTIMQRYVPEIERGEKRVLVAGGEVIGHYLRLPGGDFRTNLAQGGNAQLCTLQPDEKAACSRVARYLFSKGIVFAGLDIAWPWLLEWNVVSPGGLGTIERLGGGRLAAVALDKILANHIPNRAAAFSYAG